MDFEGPKGSHQPGQEANSGYLHDRSIGPNLDP